MTPVELRDGDSGASCIRKTLSEAPHVSVDAVAGPCLLLAGGRIGEGHTQ